MRLSGILLSNRLLHSFAPARKHIIRPTALPKSHCLQRPKVHSGACSPAVDSVREGLDRPRARKRKLKQQQISTREQAALDQCGEGPFDLRSWQQQLDVRWYWGSKIAVEVVFWLSSCICSDQIYITRAVGSYSENSSIGQAIQLCMDAVRLE